MSGNKLFGRALLTFLVAVVAIPTVAACTSAQPSSARSSTSPFVQAVPSPVAWFVAHDLAPWQIAISAGTYGTYTLSLNDNRTGEPIRAQILLNTGDIGVAVSGPSGQTLFQPARVHSGYQLQFQSVGAGKYLLTFDNTYSVLTAKQLTLRFVE